MNLKRTLKKRLVNRFGLFVTGIMGLAALNSQAQTTFNYTGALQYYTVPVGVTLIHVDAQGAQGGSITIACPATGGLGARMQGDVTVTPGEVLTILVGGQGQTQGEDGGGGGGSFVVRTGNIPLVVAGGGGGATNNIQICTGLRNGVNASITTSGTPSANGLIAGGTAGNGGGANVGSGCGGGGFYTDGGYAANMNGRGRAFVNGGAGGTGQNNNHGGYGGGGCGWYNGGNGGGGGGYSGGGTDGNYPSTYFGGGGGGGSYNIGTNQVNTAGYKTGNGLVVITPLNQFTATVTQNSSISCFGQSTASLTASPVGGTGPYSYAWSPSGGNAATATGLGAGTYTVTITDATSNVATQTFTVTQPTAIVASASSTPASCNFGGNGSATAIVSGGSPGYTYQWSNGGITATIPNLTAGNYTYTVTDVQGCTATQSIAVTEPSPITATTMQTNVSCNGGNNGDAMVMPSGGNPSYSYSWAPAGGTSSMASGLGAGTYTCTITDASGCTGTQTVTITEPAVLVASSSAGSVLCNGGTATITVSASGGTGPYTGDGTNTVTAGTYTYTVTDANGCTATTSVTVTEPAAIAVSVSQTNVSCNGGADGTIDLTVTGGTGPYTFDWNSGQFNTEDLTGLTAGSYSGVLTDANGCQDSGTIVITEPQQLAATVSSVTNVSTCGGSDGSVTIVVTGGTPGYSYLWTNGDVTAQITGLSAGVYACTITDANGCATQLSSTVSDPAEPSVSVALGIDTVCTADGAYTLSGGMPAGGTYSGPGVSGTTFTPANANAGANTITYTYTDSQTLCSGIATTVIFVDACAGVNTIESVQGFSVFPNPNNGTFVLQLNTKAAADVMIYDATGKLVSANKVQPNVQQQVSLESAGVYLITVVTADGNRSSQRVIVNK